MFFQKNPALGIGYASVNTMDDGAVAHYQGLLLSVQHRFSHGFQFNANYTDSYCLSDTDFGAALATPGNSRPFDRHADYGPCVFDTRHNFNLSMVAISGYKGANHVANALPSGWELAPLFHAASGQPLNITDGKDVSLTTLNNDRPIQLLADYSAPNKICNNGSTPCVQFLNNLAFAANPVPGGFGNLGRNSARGPAQVTFDAALSRTIKVTERYSLQARLDAFNLFNFVNFVGAISPGGTVAGFTTLSTNLSSSTFGRAQAAFDPRILQFSLKLRF